MSRSAEAPLKSAEALRSRAAVLAALLTRRDEEAGSRALSDPPPPPPPEEATLDEHMLLTMPSGSWDAEKWVAAFEASTYQDSVFGPKQMRACDHQAIGVGLWAEAVKGEAPRPPLMLKVTDTFPSDGLFPPCPK